MPKDSFPIKKTEKKYKNGLAHVHFHVPFLKTIYLGYYMKAGSSNEYQRELWGISHYLEHMVFNGSEKYPDSDETSKLVAELGALENAWTWKSMTIYYMVAPVASFQKAFDVLHDRVFHPLLTEESAEKERGIIQEEIGMYESKPDSVLGEKVFDKLYRGTSYAHKGLGERDTVAEISAEQLAKYHKAYYSPNNSSFITYGGAKYDEIEPIIEESLDKLEEQHIPNHKIELHGTDPSGGIREDEIDIKMDIEAVYYEYDAKLLAIADLESYLTYLLFTAAVNYGDGNVFNQEFRVRNALVSSIEGGVQAWRDTAGFYVTASTDVEKAAEVKALLHKILGDFEKSGITLNDFERARNYTRAKVLRELEGSWYPTTTRLINTARLNFINELGLELEDLDSKLKDLKYEDFQEGLSKILPFDEFVEGTVRPGK